LEWECGQLAPAFPDDEPLNQVNAGPIKPSLLLGTRKPKPGEGQFGKVDWKYRQ
jgi:hypothetical protein